MTELKWLPIESNPDVMTKFLVNLGLSKDWSIVDVIGFDPELLAFVPQPVAAVILLFPENLAAWEDEGLAIVPSDLFYMKQTIGNACGTIALIHAVANNTDKIQLQEGSLLKSFIEKSSKLNPMERAKELESSAEICSSHEVHAQEGQTSAPNIEDNVNYHFVAFVEQGGHLYQLDGRKKGPIDHGSTSSQTFLQDSANICKKFVEKNPDCLGFTAVALVKN